jgi:hypothetical protein
MRSKFFHIAFSDSQKPIATCVRMLGLLPISLNLPFPACPFGMMVEVPVYLYQQIEIGQIEVIQPAPAREPTLGLKVQACICKSFCRRYLKTRWPKESQLALE